LITKTVIRYIWTVSLLIYCGLIYYLSDQSQWIISVPDLFNMQDKIIHALAYAVMALLFWLAGKGWMDYWGIRQSRLLALLCVLFCAFYGLSDEWHQSFIIGRDASFFDWLADVAGALLLTMVLQKREFAFHDGSNSLT